MKKAYVWKLTFDAADRKFIRDWWAAATAKAAAVADGWVVDADGFIVGDGYNY